MRSTFAGVMLLVALVLVPPAWAQAAAIPQAAPQAKAPVEAQPANQDPLGRDTPRGTVLGFIKAADAANFERAVQYLDTRQSPKQAQELALELRVVLDRLLSAADIEQLSNQPGGDLQDNLPPNLERVGTVQTGGDTLDILLERVQRGNNPPIWLFSAPTLKRIPAIYEGIRPFWVERYMWKPLRDIRFLDLALWQWLLLPVTMVLILGATWLLSRGLFSVIRLLLFRVTGELADAQLAQVMSPVRLVAFSLAMGAWLSVTSFPLLVRLYLGRVAVAIGVVGLAWLCLRLLDISAELVEIHLRRLNYQSRIAITQLLRRLGKALVILAGGLWLLYLASIDLTAALAGLGIGGIALAFAAQKTLESLFGGILIISDQPVRVGDFCKIGNVSGTIEEIGLRSTRIRTPDRTVVSVPNSQMAAENIENFGVRDKICFRPTIALPSKTTADQLRYVLARVRRMFYEHPMVETQSARIRFVRFGTSSLDLEVFAYVLTSDYDRFVEVQEDLLLRILDIIEASGTGVAFPSSILYLTRDSGLDEEKKREAIATVNRWREKRELPFPNFHPGQISEFENRLEYPPPESVLRRSDTPK